MMRIGPFVDRFVVEKHLIYYIHRFINLCDDLTEGRQINSYSTTMTGGKQYRALL